MSGGSLRAVVLFVMLSVLTVSGGRAFAATRVMECREWVPEWVESTRTLSQTYRGLYVFSFDTNSSVLSVTQKPDEGNKYGLLLKGVAKWSVLWAKDYNAVFFGNVPDDWMGPVKILSLNFSDLTMSAYSLGGVAEQDKQVGVTERKCRRLD
jgi:hypothetical protein